MATNEIINKAIQIGYLGLSDIEKSKIAPFLTTVVFKEEEITDEGWVGPLFIDTTEMKETIFGKQQSIFINYQNSETRFNGYPNRYFALWYYLSKARKISTDLGLELIQI